MEIKLRPAYIISDRDQGVATPAKLGIKACRSHIAAGGPVEFASRILSFV